MDERNCPVCKSVDISRFLDLGMQPPANDLSTTAEMAASAGKFPLLLMICNNCLYVWLDHKVPAAYLFSNNTYLTGISSETRDHMKNLSDDCIATCKLNSSSKILDIASNDGTLLAFFKESGMQVMGIDPSAPASELANTKGINTICDFFNEESAGRILLEFGKVDIITATNVITHVSDPVSFLGNCKKILKDSGTIVLEFYNFEKIIENNAFDQIYHEHISYFNFTVFYGILKNAGLQPYKVAETRAQGGSLRVFVGQMNRHEPDDSVQRTLHSEGGPKNILRRYISFPKKVIERKNEINALLKDELDAGSVIIGYGASAKATVISNYLGFTPDTIRAIADKSPIKIGRFIPGVGIPIISPEQINDLNPDLIIIFAWNIKNEIIDTLPSLIREKCRALSLIPVIKFYTIQKT